LKRKKTVLILVVMLGLIAPAIGSQRELSPTVTITYPPDGSIIKGTVTIIVSTTGCIDMVEFYIDRVFKYADTTPPFSYTWGSMEQTPGIHTITVKGYCAGEFKDDDTISVKVL
jgi:hypothetical protein